MTTPAAKPDEASAVDPDVTDSGEQGMATHEASDLTKEDYEEIAREKLGFPKDPGAIDLEVFKECIASMPLAPLHDQAAKLVTEVEALRERVAELEQQQCAMPPTTAWRGKCGHDWRKDQAEECPICLANYYSMKYTEADDTVSRYVRERNDAEALVVELAGALEGVMPWMTGECSRTVPDEWVRAAAALTSTPAKALERARAVEKILKLARKDVMFQALRQAFDELDALGKEGT